MNPEFILKVHSIPFEMLASVICVFDKAKTFLIFKTFLTYVTEILLMFILYVPIFGSEFFVVNS